MASRFTLVLVLALALVFTPTMSNQSSAFSTPCPDTPRN